MTYRVTILTPTLVGDGQRLSPIDYMVWKDHVNILDQRRIFRLLSKGPRLESYLTQLKKSEKLDFASWGGFAQNFAGRRIPFEHPSSAEYWNRAPAESLFIPTFASGWNGPYLPASALKGALRTAVLCGLATDAHIKAAADRTAGDGRVSRQATQSLEDAVLGGGSANVMRGIGASDSAPVPDSAFMVYLLRVSSLASRGGKFELQWRQSPRGIARRLEESTALFSEMAVPGTVFEGHWRSGRLGEQAKKQRKQPDVWNAANHYAEQLLQIQALYSEWAGLPALKATVEQLQQRLGEIRAAGRGCMLVLGWGGGLLSKGVFADTQNASFRELMKQVPFYARAVQSGLPFPKTRKLIFVGNEPAALPGFVHLEAASGPQPSA